MSEYLIRPHHLLCTYFFEGKGYSEDFVKNTERLLKEFQQNPVIRLTDNGDSLCRACPYDKAGICDCLDKVKGYDKSVLEICGLEIDKTYRWNDLKDIAYKNIIINNKIFEICGNCQWFYICSSK